MLIEFLRIQLAGDAKARWIVENRADRGVAQYLDLHSDIALSQLQRASGLRRPGVEAAQPEHVGVLFIGEHLGRLRLQAPGGEVTEAAAGVENDLAAGLDPTHLTLGVSIG